ncbi:MmgE/PrpD family protein [Planococcus sp. X10-3]|uniref:MmgE/PrpD family protein n=1 Tax=Planococcus sp. X10-3 TaxID=3061240 RepID=UPI003BAFFD78
MKWTENVAKIVSDFEYNQIPNEVVDTTKRAIIDTVACMIAGKNEEATNIVVKLIREHQDDRSISTVVTKGKFSPTNAALLNGIMAHAIDFDDVNAPTHGHPSAAILPAALAATELVKGTGKELITSYVIGVELMSVLGEILGISHYEKGWHTTTTYGTLGATAAAAKALSLNQAQISQALGIATSQISGTRLNFGTMMKPYHAGNAAKIGVWSALLAKNGFTSSEGILENRMGYFDLYAGEEIKSPEIIGEIINSFGKKFRLQKPGIDIKKYPCCYWTARAADGVLDIVHNESFELEQIVRIEVITPSGGLNALIYDRPITGLQGKFSMEYVVAASLLDQKLNLKTFEDHNVNRKEIIQIEEKIVKWEDPTQSVSDGANAGHVIVNIKLTDGTLFVRKIEKPIGSAEVPLTIKELQEKMDDCISYSKQTELNSENIINNILQIDEIDNIQSWTEFLV